MPHLGTMEVALLALLAALALGPAGGLALLRDAVMRRDASDAPARPLAPAPRFCTECGTRLQPGARFCAECGSAADR